MGCGDVALRDQARVHVRLVAPRVDDKRSELGTGPQEGALVHDLTAGRIDEDGTRLNLREEFVIGHGARGFVQGDMKRDDLRLGEEFQKPSGPSFSARGGSQRRIWKPSFRPARSIFRPTCPTPTMPSFAFCSGIFFRAATP